MTYLLPTTVLKECVSIIRRAAPGFGVSRSAVRKLDQALYAVLHAVGANVNNDEYSAAFREAVGALPTAQELAEQFRKIAGAKDPLDPLVCSPDCLARMNGVARKLWADRLASEPLGRKYHLLRVNWTELTAWQQKSVRAIALQLSAEFHAKIDRGAPQKTEINGLLVQLAETYVRTIGNDGDPLDLPHAAGSRFIQFAHAASATFFPSTEVSARALSHRWRDWKAAMRRKPKPFRPVHKRIRKRPGAKPPKLLKAQ